MPDIPADTEFFAMTVGMVQAYETNAQKTVSKILLTVFRDAFGA
jgi:hypothetical protein